MKNFQLVLYFCLVRCSLENSNKILVISFDGFRYDYIDRKITPNILKLMSESTYAKVLLNVFPTQTFPNHFSIATGLYSEHHGVLARDVYDPVSKTLLTYGYALWHYNESVLPIWTLNEKHNKQSGVMMWPGSEFEYGGINATYVEKYNELMPWKDRVDKVMNWFEYEKKPASLVMMYFEQPDQDSHAYGPDSNETNFQIKRVDLTVKYILEQLNIKKIKDLNIIILSDHGMEEVTTDRIIDLKEKAGNISEMYGTSPVLQVYPHKGKEEEVFTILKSIALETKHFQVYKRNDIPDEFHYKNCARAPPIMVLAEPKYAFQDLRDTIQWYFHHHSNVKDTFGVHGYDPRTLHMHPYFIAHGPLFKRNYETDHLYTVDLYHLLVEILGLTPHYTDGDIERIRHIFISNKTFPLMTAGLFMLFFSCVIIISSIYFGRKYKKYHIVEKEETFDEKEGIALLDT